MNIIIDGELCRPPNSVDCFRHTSLYIKIKKLYCLLLAEEDNVDFYYKWLKNKYAWDHVDEIVCDRKEEGIYISPNYPTNIYLSRLNYETVDSLMSRIDYYTL